MLRKFIILMVLISAAAVAQPAWRALSAAPSGVRHDDGYFLNERLGWVCNGRGQIWKTTNGGAAWVKVFDKSTIYFRSIGFADSLRGWAGNLGTQEFGGQTDTMLIYATTDGGNTWAPQNNFIGTKPRGVCGMSVVDSTTVYGAGRVRGPAYLVKTTDGGVSWKSIDMSPYCAGLLDVKFFSRDSGYLAGLTNSPNDSSYGVVLFTSDGGTTWVKRITTSRKGEWCWKINFPSRRTGYISLQRNTGFPCYFLKTTDGGVTWQEKLMAATFNYYQQGMGFATETLGWVGGNSTYPCYETTDGGETWRSAGWGSRVNRVRMLNDSVGYAMGQTVYKYSRSPVGITEEQQRGTGGTLQQNYPNPASGITRIMFELPAGVQPNDLVKITVYDVTGREVEVIIEEIKEPGMVTVEFDASGLASGVYTYTVQAGNTVMSRKLVVQR